jgi:hypothetical protein
LQKIAEEKQKPIESQGLGLIAHWEKQLLIAVSKSPNYNGG